VTDPWQQRRPRLAYPFSILTGPNTVRLVAGEDLRYTLTASGLEHWLPSLLEQLTGREMLSVVLAALAPEQRASALEIIQRLYGERVLVDGSAADAHAPRKYHILVAGEGELCERIAARFLSLPLAEEGPGATSNPLPNLVVLCQDRLDYEQALQHNRRCRAAEMPFLWVSHGALSRAYVSPLFLHDAGPCFSCLLRSFLRLSPAPEIYDALREHARQGKPLQAAEFPHEGLLILEGLILWKLQQAELQTPSPALYRLHVLEREHCEVSTHHVFVDSFCPECHANAHVPHECMDYRGGDEDCP
jgi:hypothetical protein